MSTYRHMSRISIAWMLVVVIETIAIKSVNNFVYYHVILVD